MPRIGRALLDELQFHVGDILEVTAHADDTLTPSEAIKVRHDLSQLKQGNTRPWVQVKHELGL
jgi:hypothetical protein